MNIVFSTDKWIDSGKKTISRFFEVKAERENAFAVVERFEPKTNVLKAPRKKFGRNKEIDSAMETRRSA